MVAQRLRRVERAVAQQAVQVVPVGVGHVTVPPVRGTRARGQPLGRQQVLHRGCVSPSSSALFLAHICIWGVMASTFGALVLLPLLLLLLLLLLLSLAFFAFLPPSCAAGPLCGPPSCWLPAPSRAPSAAALTSWTLG